MTLQRKAVTTLSVTILGLVALLYSMAQELAGIRQFLAALCLLGIAFSAIAWLLLHSRVLSRLEQLRDQVSQITAHHWAAKHVEVSGKDELSQLGSTINCMLDMLRNTETKLDLLANNIHQVFWVKDAATQTFSYVSSSYEKLWGQSCESLYSDASSWLRPLVPEDQAIVEQVLETQRKGEPGEVEFRIVIGSGRTRWILDRFFPVPDTTGTVKQYIGILEDITEYKDAEHTLLNSQDQLWNAMIERKKKERAEETAGDRNRETESPLNPSNR